MQEEAKMSKQIFDYINLLDEPPLLTLSQAVKLWPTKISRASLERYLRSGIRGTYLETILVAGRRMTSEAAIRRFLVGQQNTAPENAQPTPKGKMSSRELSEKCKKYGLPE